MEDITVFGINHQTAPVGLREKLAFTQDQLPQALKAMQQELEIPECAILSTCNRVELYALTPQAEEWPDRLGKFLADFHGVDADELKPVSYAYQQPESVRHLFKVTSGLDSMVVGETEILGQVRDAYQRSVDHAAAGKVFHKLFQTAIRAGKQVQTHTQVGRGLVSVSSVAVELAKRIFQNLSRKKVLLLGAGQMAETTLMCLKDKGVKNIWIANRTFETAQSMADTMGARALKLARVPDALTNVDIVICSTGASQYVVEAEDMQSVMRTRRQAPLFCIDISVPRNLDPAIGALENVYLYDIDDLKNIVNANQKRRLGQVEEGLSIVEKELKTFLDRFHNATNHVQSGRSSWVSSPKERFELA